MVGVLFLVFTAVGWFCVFCYGLGWFVPLAAARRSASPPQSEPQPLGPVYVGLIWGDLVMMMLDCIPVFWAIRLFMHRGDPEATWSKTAEAARQKWREDDQVRWCFKVWVGSCAVAVVGTVGLWMA